MHVKFITSLNTLYQTDGVLRFQEYCKDKPFSRIFLDCKDNTTVLCQLTVSYISYQKWVGLIGFMISRTFCKQGGFWTTWKQ